MDDSERFDALDEAARLVAGQEDGVARLRRAHQPRPDGSCAGCGYEVRVA